MIRLVRLTFLSTFLLLGREPGRAQDPVAPVASLAVAPGDTSPPAPTPKRRAISGGVAAQLQAATPKYTPPPPKPEPKPEEELVDLRDIDKPKNGIIRLPKYIVQEKKPAVLSERAVNTGKGLADLAMRRYISDSDRALNGFTLPLFGTSAEARALAMYAEDERLRNMGDLSDAARMVGATDKSAGQMVRRAAQETYLREPSFPGPGGGPK